MKVALLSLITSLCFGTSWFFIPTPAASFLDTYSVQFNGTTQKGSVSTALNASMERTSAFSWSCWIRPGSVSGEKTFISNRNGGGGYRGFVAETLGTGFLIQLANSGSNLIDVRSTSVTLSTNTWYHVAITYSGSSAASGMKLYVNGSAATMSTTSNSLSATSVSAQNLWAAFDDQGSYFSGHIDDVSFFTVELTSGEVSELYNSGDPNNVLLHSQTANLAGYWLMGDGSGDDNTTIYDQKSSNNMTLTNTPTISTTVP